MKKKSLYVGGMLLLASAIGFSAMAVSGLISNPFGAVATAEGDEEEPEVKTVACIAQYPENDATISSTLNVQELWIGYKTGDMGITMLRSADKSIVVKKDGEVLYTFSTEDTAHVTDSRSYPNRLYIKLDAPLTQAGTYTVEVPEGIVEITAAANPEAGEENTPQVNEAYEWSFIVNAELTYTVSPKVNSEVSANQLATIRLTYPAGTEITFANDTVGYLQHVALGNVATVLTKYVASYEAPVLTLKAVDVSAITANTQPIDRQWETLVIPAGKMTVKNGSTSYLNTLIEVGPYAVRAFAASEFTFTPALDTPGLTIEDLDEITMDIPEGAEWYKTLYATTVIFNLYPDPISTTYYYQYAFKEMSADGRKITGVRKEATSSTSAMNNTALCQTGTSTLRLLSNSVRRIGQTAGNANLDIPAYNLVGVDYLPIYNSTPKSDDVVTSITGLTLNALRNAYVVDPDAEITLEYEGEIVNRVKAGATTTANALKEGTGATSIAYANLFKDASGNAYTEPGVYTYRIPANTFRQVNSEYQNIALTITAYIGADGMPYTASPVTATFTGTTTNLTAVLPEGAEAATSFDEITLTFPEGSQVSLLGGYKNALANSGIGYTGASNALKLAQNISPTYVNGVSFTDAVVNGNTVTLKLNQPYRKATPKNYAVSVKIYRGVFMAKVPDGEGGYVEYPNKDMNLYYKGIPMAKGQIATLDTAEDGSADLQYLSSENSAFLGSTLGTIIYTGYENLYPAANTTTNPLTAYLYDENETKIATYKGQTPAEDLRLAATSIEFIATEDIGTVPSGNYRFEIQPGCLIGGSATSATLQVSNTGRFNWNIEVINVTSAASPGDGASVPGLDKIDFTFTGVSSIDLNSELVPTVTYPAKYTEGLYEGDTYQRDITLDGHKVEFTVNPAEAGGKIVTGQLTITPALIDPASYSVHIPAGIMMYNGKCASEAQDYVISVETVFTEASAVEPGEETVDAFTAVTLTYPGESLLAYDKTAEVKFFKNGDLVKSFNITDETSCKIEGNKVTFIYDENSLGKGEYEIEVPENLFVLDDYTHTAKYEGLWAATGPNLFNDIVLTPAAGTEVAVAGLDELTITLPEGATFGAITLGRPAQAKRAIGLYDEDDNMVATYVTDDVVEGESSIKINISLIGTIEGGKAYTLKLLSGFWNLTFQGDTYTNAEDVVFNYTTEQPGEEFINHIGLNLPNSFDANPSNTRSPFGTYGMGLIGLDIDSSDIVVNDKCTATIKYFLNGELLTEFVPSEDRVMIVGAGQFSDDSGLVEIQPIMTAYFLLDESMEDEKYLQKGTYELVIPDGAFKMNGRGMTGTTLTYTFDPDSTTEYAYELTPNPENEYTEDPKDVLGKITITFPEAKQYVTWGDFKTGGASLIGPDGVEIPQTAAARPKTTSDYKGIIYTFGAADTVWPQIGAYTFSIQPNSIGIDYYMDEEDDGNFQGLSVIYNVDNVTSVALIGIAGADSYNVYTLDGKAVKLNAAPEEMFDIEPGLYIINGKKVYLRK